MEDDDNPPRAPLNGLSHVRGALAPALSDRTFGQWLDDTAARWPEHLACLFCDSGVRWTGAQAAGPGARAGALHARAVAGSAPVSHGDHGPQPLLTGKAQKFLMRQAMVAELGLDGSR